MNLRSVQNTMAMTMTAILLCLLLPHGMAVAQKAMEVQPPPAPSPASPAPIPVAEVTLQSRGVSNLLRSLNTELLAYGPEIKRIQEQLIKVREQGNRDFAATATILEGTPTLKILQSVQEIWQQVQRQTSQRLTLLTGRATHLQKALDQLANLQETWAKTRDAAEAANAPGPILQEIRATIADLEAARPALQAQHARVLDLQSAVAQEVARCETMLARFAQAQQEAVAGILTQDGPPIWNPHLWDTSLATLGTKVGGTADFYREVFGRHIRHSSSGIALQIALFAVLAVLFGAARRQIARWSEEGKSRLPYTTVFDYPYAAALLVPLALGSGPIWPVPAMVRQLSAILALLPMIRLTRQVASSKLIPWLYTLAILFAVDTLRQALSGAPPLEQAVLLSEAFAGMVLLGWSLGYGGLRRPSTQVISGVARLRAFQTGSFLVLIILAGGFAAGVLGYLRLARLLVSGLLVVGVLAVELYSVLRVVSGLLAFTLHVWPLRRLYMVQHHAESLAHRSHQVLTLVAVVTWVNRSLDYVGLLEPARSLAGAILFTKLQHGSLSISLGDVLAFVLTVWASYLFSALIRFVLREDIYPRTRIASGLSYAVSSLLHYLILVVGFVLGLAALGDGPQQSHRAGRCIRCGHRLWAAERGEQLRLGADSPLRATDPRRGHHRGRQSGGRRTPHRHPR